MKFCWELWVTIAAAARAFDHMHMHDSTCAFVQDIGGDGKIGVISKPVPLSSRLRACALRRLWLLQYLQQWACGLVYRLERFHRPRGCNLSCYCASRAPLQQAGQAQVARAIGLPLA